MGFDRGWIKHRGKRLELPLFEGDDPFGWLFRVERNFAVNGMPDGDKVYDVSVDSQIPFQSWREFHAAVMQQFGRAQEGDPTEQLLGIKQDSSVAEYRARFEQFAASSQGLPDSVFRGTFLNGLKEEIRSDVKLLRPANLPDAMTLAQEIEERNELWEKHWGLQVLLLSEDDSNPKLEISDMEQASPNSFSSLNLSYNSLLGFTSSHTMKVKGQLGSREVVILIDSGASHSFVASKLVRELGMQCEATAAYGVQMGNGMNFKQQGVCRGVRVLIQGCEVVDDFFPFELGSADMVLGVTWLRTLGMVHADWEQFSMSFWMNGAWVSLKGDPDLCQEDKGQPLPLQLSDYMKLLGEWEARLRIPGNVQATELMVKWPNGPDWGASWEPSASIRSQSSDFNLEDKVVSEGRSNDRTQNKHVYARRGRKVFERGELAKGNT
ncbi:hypothetical protein UlMin_033210 [Ulmus minor]